MRNQHLSGKWKSKTSTKVFEILDLNSDRPYNSPYLQISQITYENGIENRIIIVEGIFDSLVENSFVYAQNPSKNDIQINISETNKNCISIKIGTNNSYEEFERIF